MEFEPTTLRDLAGCSNHCSNHPCTNKYQLGKINNNVKEKTGFNDFEVICVCFCCNFDRRLSSNKIQDLPDYLFSNLGKIETL